MSDGPNGPYDPADIEWVANGEYAFEVGDPVRHVSLHDGETVLCEGVVRARRYAPGIGFPLYLVDPGYCGWHPEYSLQTR